jgi:glycerol uptake facilitator-like aquaporin
LPRPIAALYILAQFCGAFVGCEIMTWIQKGSIKPYSPNNGLDDTGTRICPEDKFSPTLRAMIQESLGSFIYVFFYLTQSEKRTMMLSKEKAIYCLIIAASFVTARAIVFG